MSLELQKLALRNRLNCNARVLMRDIIKIDTPADMLDTVVDTLCRGPHRLTGPVIYKNCMESLFDDLSSELSIVPVDLGAAMNFSVDGDRLFKYVCVVGARIDIWIQKFLKQYS